MNPATSGPGLDCHDDRRRHALREKGWNGLDYVEVSNDQRKLTVYFLNQAPEDVRKENIRLEGCGRGARAVRVIDIRFCYQDDPELDDCLQVYVDRPGDHSKYRLCIVEVDENGEPTDQPFHGFDPRYSCLEVDFKVGCPGDLDCKAENSCPPETRDEPEINYLAKDYASFRQLLLDRLALIMPDWKERHAADLGIALVELLAYVGDHLSYYQDAVGTEAYLDTARRRTSVRRHVRLIDYPMHDGCNARAWVAVQTNGPFDLQSGDFCITGFAGGPAEGRALQPHEIANFAGRYEVFEPIFGEDEKIVLLPEHNEIPFYLWGDRDCCLPRGATRATLLDEWLPQEPPEDGEGCEEQPQQQEKHRKPPQQEPPRRRKLRLRAGDLLLFEEILGPRTHHPGDADLAHRHVVRLTRVREEVDALWDTPVLEIEWAMEDALPFPLCLSSIGPAPGCESRDGVSVARGNVFLADHGRTWKQEAGPVAVRETVERCEGEGRPSEVEERAERFRPRLERAPLTFRAPLPRPLRSAPASRLFAQDPREALPAVRLSETSGANWEIRRDLLASGAGETHCVAEVDDAGAASLRFGDGDCGRTPRGGTVFEVTYRAGNGPAGNVGIGAIRHLVLENHSIDATVTVSNPLPAQGGTAPEPVAEVRLLAPHAFRQDLRRAITADDYARLAERDFRGRVQRAAAALYWTGSWYEVRVAIDPVGGGQDDGLLEEVRRRLERYRRIGHDVAVTWARSVPLLIELGICVRSGFLRGHVKSALLDVFSARGLPDGRRGFFHSDNLTFGEGIALSRLVAAAQGVAGVEGVQVKTLERLGLGPRDEIGQGFLPLGPFEIARLDNDSRFPGNGQLRLDLRGGR
jgi:hypothetical protein